LRPTRIPGELARIAARYTAFATDEARDASAIYERLALATASSPVLLEFLATLPADRRQPNLFLAAIRHLHGVPDTIDRLTEIVRHDDRRVRALMLSRTTQTNEPARCAVLLPLLAQLPQPLALIEVGASAGLCLLPDRYGYDYGAARIGPADDQAPVFECQARGAVPVPAAIPRIVWRRGLDLNPNDLRSDDDVAWLETLVWPGRETRARNLRLAIDIARRDPPQIALGDLRWDLAPLIAAAPREAPSVFPAFASVAPPAAAPGLFLLMRDGVPVAWAGPHGQSIDWFGSP